jgi:transposase
MQQELRKKNVDIARLKSLFGLTTSEKTRKVLGAGAKAKDAPEDRDAGAKPPKKRKGHGRKAAADYDGAERIEVSHDSLKSGDPCPECPPNMQGKVYTMSQPRVLVRVTGQTPLQATLFELERLRCNLCGMIFTADAPEGVGDEKYDAKAASMIALLRYGTGLPFNRLEKLQGDLGIPLPSSTQWDIVEEAAGKITPIHAEFIRQAAQGRLLHNDDTSMKVLELRKEIDGLVKAGETKRTGIFSTGVVSQLEENHRIALYFTGRQHAGENLADLLGQRAAALEKPMQMCDGLDRNEPGEFETVIGNCLAHARRKFVEVVNSFPDECRKVLNTLGDVYKHDKTARERAMSDAERLSYHQEHSRPSMDGLRVWMDEQFEKKLVEPNSALGDAIQYMTKRWNRLTLFLRVPGAVLDNNIVERALKKAVLHRRNSLFYKTENGAQYCF